MSLYSGVVEYRYNWRLLEEQPLYVKSKRIENAKCGYRIGLSIDRTAEKAELRGESFYIYGENIPDLEENEDVVIKIDPDKSYFFRDKSGSGMIPYIVVQEVMIKNRRV